MGHCGRSSGNQPGFTLVDLLIAMALLAVLIGIAAPGFARLSDRLAIRTTAQELMVAIAATRSEAIKRNRRVALCAKGLLVPCTGALDQGWQMIVDDDQNHAFDDADTLLRDWPPVPAHLSLTNRAATRDADEKIIYRPDGSSRRNLTVMVCSRRYPELTSWSVVLNRVGRPRLASGWGECPAQ